MVRLLLVRHGETYDNAQKIMQGQTHGKLNENGIEQAQKLSEDLAKEQIDVFVSSDLYRSVQTCDILAAKHKLRPISTPLLRERDWGSFTGQHIPSLAHLNDPSKWPSDIESLEDLQQRARHFIAWLCKHYDGKRVVAVGHGIINKAIQSVHYNKSMQEIKPMHNIEVRELQL